MNAETPLSNRIRLAASEHGAILFRNVVGKFKTATGLWVRCGLATGSSDLIGWDRTGHFLAVEIKVPGARTDPARLESQSRFIAAVLAAGGRGGFASSPDDLKRILE